MTGGKPGDLVGYNPVNRSTSSVTPMNIADTSAPNLNAPGGAYTDFEARPVVNQMANTHHGNYATANQ